MLAVRRARVRPAQQVMLGHAADPCPVLLRTSSVQADITRAVVCDRLRRTLRCANRRFVKTSDGTRREFKAGDVLFQVHGLMSWVTLVQPQPTDAVARSSTDASDDPDKELNAHHKPRAALSARLL